MPRGVPRVPEAREWVLTRKCTRCCEVKPWAKFSPAAYWPSGEVLKVSSMCHVCQSKASWERQQREPEDVRARRFEYRRQWDARRVVRLRENRKRGGSPARSPHHFLPAQPFRDWLLGQAAGGRDWQALAHECGVQERSLRRVALSDQEFAMVTLVDQCLTKTGFHLSDLYPEVELAA